MRAASQRLEVDHLVIAAASLESGTAWCEDLLGVPLEPGGRHARFGTHNRLLDLSSARHPRCYLEILAVDPEAAAPPHPRWFGLDDPALRREIARAPRLVQWAVRVPAGRDIDAVAAEWRAAGADPGEVTAAERMTPRGVLRWRLSVRGDGARPFGGGLPALIDWGDVHPSGSLPARGVSLASLAVRSLPATVLAALGASVDALGDREPTALRVELETPRGRVALEAPEETKAC
ncbi:MAG TPA: VOC family protein [Caldimonas sp.]|nr:VOC family protein [Caldimonas sp.]